MAASLFGYALTGPPPKNRWRWLAWLVAVVGIILAVGIPATIGAVGHWIDFAETGEGRGQAILSSLLPVFLLFPLTIVVVMGPSQWRFHRERDAEAESAEDGLPPGF
ncbi:hypothetical protein LG299_10815 [Microbacterium lacus]|uniref:hypothetical protein n=1 Tax=Microbacterium lacus TaxID=415217 RepID=UPI00384C8C1B